MKPSILGNVMFYNGYIYWFRTFEKLNKVYNDILFDLSCHLEYEFE